MAITRIQSKTGNRTGVGTTMSISLTSPPLNGSTLLIGTGLPSAFITISSVSSSNATWQLIKRQTNVNGSSNLTAEIWAAYNVQNAGSDVTVSLSSPNTTAVGTVVEYSTIFAFDVSSGSFASGSASINIGTTPLTTYPVELVFSNAVDNTGTDGGTWTPGVGYTNIAYHRAGPYQLITDEKITSAIEAAANSGSRSVATSYCGAIATFYGSQVSMVNEEDSLWFIGY